MRFLYRFPRLMNFYTSFDICWPSLMSPPSNYNLSWVESTTWPRSFTQPDCSYLGPYSPLGTVTNQAPYVCPLCSRQTSNGLQNFSDHSMANHYLSQRLLLRQYSLTHASPQAVLPTLAPIMNLFTQLRLPLPTIYPSWKLSTASCASCLS